MILRSQLGSKKENKLLIPGFFFIDFYRNLLFNRIKKKISKNTNNNKVVM